MVIKPSKDQKSKQRSLNLCWEIHNCAQSFMHGQGQGSEQKHTTQNFVGFHNHFPLVCSQLLNLSEGNK